MRSFVSFFSLFFLRSCFPRVHSNQKIGGSLLHMAFRGLLFLTTVYLLRILSPALLAWVRSEASRWARVVSFFFSLVALCPSPPQPHGKKRFRSLGKPRGTHLPSSASTGERAEKGGRGARCRYPSIPQLSPQSKADLGLYSADQTKP